MIDVDFYRKNGFVHSAAPVFRPDEFAELQDLCKRIFTQHPDDMPFLQNGNLHVRYPELLYYLTSPAVLSRVTAVLGPHFGLWTSVLFYKQAGARYFFEWHSDFNQSEFFEDFVKMQTTNMLIAITPSTLTSGCVRYMPGTHLQKDHRKRGAPAYEQVKDLAPHFYKKPGADQHSWPQFVSVEMQPNECSFHDGHILHSSEPNRSTQDRVLLNFWFFNTDISHFSPAAKKYVASQSAGRIHLSGRDDFHTCHLSLAQDLKS